MKKVALLGLGRMGRGIALSILRSGQPLYVWNRTAAKAAEVTAAGAVLCQTVQEAAADADVVIAMLADDHASEEVWIGKNGAMQVMKPGAAVVECSTLSLDYVKRLSSIAKERELIYIDCPVTGIPAAAAKADITLLVGAASEDLQRCRSLMQTFSRCIRYFGAIGSGTSYKLVINLMGAVQIAGLAEGITLCKKLGLDMETVIEAIENSAAASPQVLRYVRRMAESDFSGNPSFTVDLREKDADYALRLARETGFNASLGAAAGQWFTLAKRHNNGRDEAIVINEMLK